jgi:hypothetical protein
MAVDKIDRWTERAPALPDSPEGRRIYARNKYDRVEAELAARKKQNAD